MQVQIIKIFVIISIIVSYSVTCTETVDEALVDYYVKLINKRAQEAAKYKFPTDARKYEPEDKTVTEYGKYDFIVIGAGSTGCIVTNRLSEIGKWKILLLEAGTYPEGHLTGIPSMFNEDGMSDFNWGYTTVPQKYACLSNDDHKCTMPRGRGIGGTSLINALIYARGTPYDYQRWSDLLNDTSFKYENVLPYFIKSENFTKRNPYVPIDSKYHGHEGPLHTSHTVPPANISAAILQASQEMGYDIIDSNGRRYVGGTIGQYYIDNGRRDDPGKAFISSIRNRKNLEVLDNSFVTKLEINEDTKEVTGVIFTRNNKTYIARIKKEVILSAGAFNSPQILMLSGIGPQDHLQSLGIPVIQNLPVGETLHDHVIVLINMATNSSTPAKSIEELVRHFLKGKGPLTRSFAFDAIAWYKIPKKTDENTPDLELVFTNTSVLMTICHPKSSGSVKLKSSDPFDYPLIDSNILSDERDLEDLYEALQVTLKLNETEAFRKMNISLAFVSFPECNHTKPSSKDFWYCYLRRATTPAYHVISSCLTGTSPETGVVDKELKVFGVKKLRVADASVVPLPMANHPTATLFMIAEKVSDQIKREYGI